MHLRFEKIYRRFRESKSFLALLTGSSPSVVGAYTMTTEFKILEFHRKVHLLLQKTSRPKLHRLLTACGNNGPDGRCTEILQLGRS